MYWFNIFHLFRYTSSEEDSCISLAPSFNKSWLYSTNKALAYYKRALKGSLECEEAVLGIGLILNPKTPREAKDLVYSIVDICLRSREFLEEENFFILHDFGILPMEPGTSKPQMSMKPESQPPLPPLPLPTLLCFLEPSMSENFARLGFGAAKLVSLAKDLREKNNRPESQFRSGKKLSYSGVYFYAVLDWNQAIRVPIGLKSK